MSTFIELIQSTFTKIQGKIPVRGTLTTPSGSETFPIVICNEVMGGMFVVNHIDELSSIPLERLLKGCKCVVNEFTGDGGKQIPTTTYQLNRMPQESDFTELPVLVGGVPTSETYKSLNSYSEFWVLDSARQQELGTLMYQYADNYNNKQPPYTEPAITKENYQDGYADNSGDISKLIWTDTFDAGVHKWQRQKVGQYSDWSIPVSIATTFEANDFVDTLYQWTENDLNGPVNPGAPPSILGGYSNSEPVGWSDVPPTPPTDYTTYINTHSLWETSATKDGYYNLKSVWSTPKLISTNPDLVRYGQNYNAALTPTISSEWHVFYEPNDIFKASRATIADIWVISKITQESGEYTDGVYKAFSVDATPSILDAPTTLLGYGQDNWQDGPFVTEPGYILYKSECRKRANGTQVTAWGEPIKANGDSTIRAIIVSQDTIEGSGKTLFKYAWDKGVKVVAPASIVLGVEAYDGINKLSLGTDPSQFKILGWYRGNTNLLTTSPTITVSPNDVLGTESYSVKISYGIKEYIDTITISDATDGVGYIAIIDSATGFTYKDGNTKTFTAHLFENGVDIINTANNLTCVWKLGGSVQLNSGYDYDIDIPAVSVSGSAALTLEITKDVGLPTAATYSTTETLTDIVDGASLVRYYSASETQPEPLTPSPSEIPSTVGITWTNNPAGAIWVVERLSNTLVWNAAYRVKGEKGTPNGGFQKTVYLKQLSAIPAPGKPTANTGQGDLLTPAGWSDVPPDLINPDETTYGSQAMFTKNPGNNNMELIVANWTITTDGWSTPFKLTTSFVGGIGPAGANGTNGYIPQFKLYDYLNNTKLIQLHKWVDNAGNAAPAAPAGPTVGWLTPNGLSASPDATGNIKGDAGPVGVFDKNSYWGASPIAYTTRGGFQSTFIPRVVKGSINGIGGSWASWVFSISAVGVVSFYVHSRGSGSSGDQYVNLALSGEEWVPSLPPNISSMVFRGTTWETETMSGHLAIECPSNTVSIKALTRQQRTISYCGTYIARAAEYLI